MTVWPDGQGIWTTGPLELKKFAYNILFKLMVLLAIHGRLFYLFASIAYYQPFFVAQTCAPRFHLKQVRNNPTITAFVCFQKFPGTFKALCLLLLSEQMRYPPSANLSQVQTLSSELFAQCLLICQYIYLYLWQTIAHPVRPQLYSSDVSLGNRGFMPSRTGIIFNRKFPSFKSFSPPNGIEMVWGPYKPHNSLNICFESILSIMRHLI